jgi:hypothetical protein
MSLELYVAIPHRGRNYVDDGSGNLRMSGQWVAGLADGAKLWIALLLDFRARFL